MASAKSSTKKATSSAKTKTTKSATARPKSASTPAAAKKKKSAASEVYSDATDQGATGASLKGSGRVATTKVDTKKAGAESAKTRESKEAKDDREVSQASAAEPSTDTALHEAGQEGESSFDKTTTSDATPRSRKPSAAQEGESALSAKEALSAAREAISSAREALNSAKVAILSAKDVIASSPDLQDKDTRKTMLQELSGTLKTLVASVKSSAAAHSAKHS